MGSDSLGHRPLIDSPRGSTNLSYLIYAVIASKEEEPRKNKVVTARMGPAGTVTYKFASVRQIGFCERKPVFSPLLPNTALNFNTAYVIKFIFKHF